MSNKNNTPKQPNRQNTAWTGPDLDLMEAAFVAAFIPPPARASFRTIIRQGQKVLAEWFSLNHHPGPEREQIAADIGAVIGSVELCTFCYQPADPTLLTADWPMCPGCFSEIAGPWPEEELPF